MKRILIGALMATICLGIGLAISCSSGGTSNDDDDSATAQISGALQKGPFVLGSTVNISPVDDQGNPTGQVYNTKTINDMGEFSLAFNYQGYVSLEGSGFYYNEVTGDLSTAGITLRGFADIPDGGSQVIYLNIITHMAYDRVKKLITTQDEFDGAIQQAEQELRDAIAVGPPQGLPISDSGTEMNILGGNDLDNAYLFAVSAVMAQAGGTDAGIQELVNKISLDISDDGQLTEETVGVLHEAQIALDAQQIMDALAARLADIGSSAEVPDLNIVLDQDFDNVVNADDNCPFDSNPEQEDEDGDKIGDACDCGNGKVDIGEDCDDGNQVENDGCDNECKFTDVFVDSTTGLMWQMTPPDGHMNWSESSTYCSDLTLLEYKNWRLPTISELRSLISGCDATETGGSCGVTDDCVAYNACWDESCRGCDPEAGPGSEGSYWLPELPGNLLYGFWSSTKVNDYNNEAWGVDGLMGSIGKDSVLSTYKVRCVR